VFRSIFQPLPPEYEVQADRSHPSSQVVKNGTAIPPLRRKFSWRAAYLITNGYNFNNNNNNNKTKLRGLQSASELYRPSDRRLLAKFVPTFADRGCRVVSATDPYGR
jgi:hypothetical protein